MLKRFKEAGNSQIMVSPVPDKDISSYGIVDCGGVTLNVGESI